MTRLTPLAFTVSMSALLAACGGQPDTAPADETPSTDTAMVAETATDMVEDASAAMDAELSGDLAWAMNGDWRADGARARDAFRNPQETLSFFDIQPSERVMEIWPGGGWYTDILAPWTHANGGQYVAAWPPINPDNERSVAFADRFADKFGNDTFGTLERVEFGPETGPLGEAGSIDAIVTFRNTHSWLGRGMAEKAFADFYAVLKPGGTLGLVQHRLPADRVQDPSGSGGYVQQDFVIALAQEAGFELVETSEINANPADTADHPFGVWTLPPVSRTSDFGEPANPDFDRTPYDAIGESDRMTVLFRKPDASVDAQ